MTLVILFCIGFCKGQSFYKNVYLEPNETYLASATGARGTPFLLASKRLKNYMHYRLYAFTKNGNTIENQMVDSFHLGFDYQFGGYNFENKQHFLVFNYRLTNTNTVSYIRKIENDQKREYYLPNRGYYVVANGIKCVNDSLYILFGEAYKSLTSENENLVLLALNSQMECDTNFFYKGEVEINFRAGTSAIDIWPSSNKKHFDGGFLKGISLSSDSTFWVFGAYENAANYQSAALLIKLNGQVETNFIGGKFGQDYMPNANDFYNQIHSHNGFFYLVHNDYENAYLSIFDSITESYIIEFKQFNIQSKSSCFGFKGDSILLASVAETASGYHQISVSKWQNQKMQTEQLSIEQGLRLDVLDVGFYKEQFYWLIFDYQTENKTQTVVRMANFSEPSSLNESTKGGSLPETEYDILGRKIEKNKKPFQVLIRGN